jgi:hypothetical protein
MVSIPVHGAELTFRPAAARRSVFARGSGRPDRKLGPDTSLIYIFRDCRPFGTGCTQ